MIIKINTGRRSNKNVEAQAVKVDYQKQIIHLSIPYAVAEWLPRAFDMTIDGVTFFYCCLSSFDDPVIYNEPVFRYSFSFYDRWNELEGEEECCGDDSTRNRNSE